MLRFNNLFIENLQSLLLNDVLHGGLMVRDIGHLILAGWRFKESHGSRQLGLDSNLKIKEV